MLGWAALQGCKEQSSPELRRRRSGTPGTDRALSAPPVDLPDESYGLTLLPIQKPWLVSNPGSYDAAFSTSGLSAPHSGEELNFDCTALWQCEVEARPLIG
jgi:hypothetical protein